MIHCVWILRFRTNESIWFGVACGSCTELISECVHEINNTVNRKKKPSRYQDFFMNPNKKMFEPIKLKIVLYLIRTMNFEIQCVLILTYILHDLCADKQSHSLIRIVIVLVHKSCSTCTQSKKSIQKWH